MPLQLRQLIRDEIHGRGSISFARFMERALYEPGLGFYATGRNRTGKKGDFITNVTVGSCFGTLLAARIAEFWHQLGSPDPFHVVEQGANDGQLMQDILQWLEEKEPDCRSAVSIHFIEPLETARAAQSERCPQALWHDAMPETLGANGVFFCNELLDAFPVQRFTRTSAGWMELVVGLDGSGDFIWEQAAAAAESSRALDASCSHFRPAEGFTTELCPGLQPWMKAVAGLFEHGLWMITDYGLHAEEYYSPGRPSGTLRGYRQHQLVSGDYLVNPGEIDLTCHINWTLLTDQAPELGWRVIGLEDQSRFLTKLVIPMLKAITDPDPTQLRWLRQFQTLTHPGQLGSKFQTLQLAK